MANSTRNYLAVDLGASSGRVLAGRFDGRSVALEEVYRFGNGGVTAGGTLYWDLLRLWSEIQHGLRLAQESLDGQIVSLGVDTWGVDFGLLDANDQLLGNPVHYRDQRTQGILPRAFSVATRDEIFEATGLQFMEFNTLFQLWAMKQARSPILEAAEHFLMMPDLFHWLLTGQKRNELTNASTTQFLDPRTRQWATSLLQRMDIPTSIFGELAAPGTQLGPLRREVAAATGLHDVNVILPGTHDTASAVMAVPSSSPISPQPDWCYISSGTWSLMGVEVPEPVITPECQRLNFTNEGGIGGSVRLLKNIAGLWLVQECRRVWALEGREYSWEELNQLAAAAEPLQAWIDPDDPRFTAPENMPEAIREYCAERGHRIPQTEGEIIRCALESLALRYRLVVDWLEQLTQGKIKTVHIVGGGAQNELLCQMTADALDRAVVAGPVEATAIGNLMTQAMSLGDVTSIQEAREVVYQSFAARRYDPQGPAAWEASIRAFAEHLG